MAEQIPPAHAVRRLVACILPDFPDDSGLRVKSLDAGADFIQEFVRQLIRNIQAVAGNPQIQPSAKDAIFPADKLAVGGIPLV